jgi:hypothetical protein
MSRHVAMQFCSVSIGEPLTSGPIILGSEDEIFAVCGTKSGHLIKAPLVFSKVRTPRTDFERIEIRKGTTTSLKQMFLDEEFSSAIVSIIPVREAWIITLQDGETYRLEHGASKKIHETRSAINSSGELIVHKGEQLIAFGTLEGELVIITPEGEQRALLKIADSIRTSPTYCSDTNRLLIPTGEGKVHCFSIVDELLPEPDWVFDTQSGKPIEGSLASGRLLGTKEAYYVFGSSDKHLYCIDQDGVLVWKFVTEGRVLSGVTIADINNDGVAEIVFGSCDDRTYVLNAYGNELWNYETDFWVVAQPQALAVNDPNNKEIFIGSYDSNLYCFAADADFVPSFFSGASGIVQQAATFETTSSEALAGYFARELFTVNSNGMIMGLTRDEDKQVIAGITNKGELLALRFTSR